MKSISFITVVYLSSAANAFQNGGTRSSFQYKYCSSAREMSSIMDSEESTNTARRFPYATSLSVATLKDAERIPAGSTSSSVDKLASLIPKMSSSIPNVMERGGNSDAIGRVLSASLLITGNTVGSSMFVLPDAVGGVGMVWGSGIFFALYIYNLISGLMLMDVSINLHESSECEVPSSFKDFVDTALKSETAGTVMAVASVLSNSCFLAFGTVHAGNLLASTFPGLGLEPIMGAGAFAALLAVFSLTQTNTGLEKVANMAVMVLFSSFAMLLLPSMANVSDPMGTLLAPGANTDGFSAGLAAAAPLLLSSLVYQNIVPSITKLLDFDRTKSTLAIAIGSFIPMAMYVAWCFATLGGGLDSSTASGAGVFAFTAFSASALFGSSITAVMSLAEEYESLFSGAVEDDANCSIDIFSSAAEDDANCSIDEKFSVPAVTASMVPPIAVALAFSQSGDLTGALHFNGAFITPFLYGLLPIILYRTIQQKDDDASITSLSSLPEILLGAGTIGFLLQEIIQDISNLPNLIA